MVYTRPWVVNLILDLVGYREQEDLVSRVAVEPAAGGGAFLNEMVRRLVTSCKRQGLPLSAAAGSIRAYEVNAETAELTRSSIAALLLELGIPVDAARDLVRGWVWTADYLTEWSHTPPADFVVGNPPYIRLEDVPESIASGYRRMYHTMVGRADIYIAFFEAALRQLAPGGACGFVCADRWMLNQYGAELRRLITENFSVETVIEMHRAEAFESQVSAYPAITVIRRALQGQVVIASAGAEAGKGRTAGLADSLLKTVSEEPASPAPRGFRAARSEGWFHGEEPWPSVSPARLALLKRLEAQFGPLEDDRTDTHVSIGVATGTDKVFVTRDARLVEPSRLVPLAMGPDTRGGTVEWSGHYLVDPWESNGKLVDLAAYPRLRDYYEAHREFLVKRHTAQRHPTHWYRTIDRVHHELTPLRKLYLPDIKGVIHPVLDVGTTYPHHNLYVVYSQLWDIEVLGGLLLSSVAQFFVECYAVRMRGGWLRFQAQYLRRIRVPDPGSIPAKAASALQAAFRTRDVKLANATAFGLYNIEAIPEEEDLGS